MTYFDYIVDKDANVAAALAILEQNEYKALILEEDGALRGIVTDGDIRRFLLSDGDLTRPVSAVATKKPTFVEGYHEQTARDLLEELDCTCVPMVGMDGHIHALVFDEITLHREQDDLDNHVVIMAGGFGTRLYPYTEILPKPLIPIGRATITELIIDRFKKFGCRDISLVVNHKKNLIKSYFSEIETDYTLDFVDEDKPLGTGGGLAFFKGKFEKPAFVTYCDNVIEADYRDILKRHNREGNILTIVAARKKTSLPYGVIETDDTGAVLAIHEKPTEEYLINAGFYIVSPEFIEMVEDNTFQHITDLIEQCHKAGKRVGIYAVDGDCFIDIGQVEDLKDLGNKLR